MIILSAVTLLLLLAPSDAFAWGAGFHLQLGTTVLNNLSSLQPAIAAIIREYPNDFLYGCIAADITIGKKFTHYLQHCHRWPIGFKILSTATGGVEKACALGYLSHLAADTIAHNYFVPYKIMRSFPTITMKHAYWEMRFDSHVDKNAWATGKRVSMEHYKINDALLRKVLSDTIFSFATNKRIFNSILLLGRLEKWQTVLKKVSESSRHALEPGDRTEYEMLSEKAVFDFLNNMEDSRYYLADPTGERALATAEMVRKNLRILYKSGKITREQAFGQLEEMKHKLESSICSPAMLQQIHPTRRDRITEPPVRSRY
jgi:hypothetical protein